MTNLKTYFPPDHEGIIIYKEEILGGEMNKATLFKVENRWFLGFPQKSESYWFDTLKEALKFMGIDYYPEKPGIYVSLKKGKQHKIKNNVIK